MVKESGMKGKAAKRGGRGRADSVLETKMDGMQDLKKLKSSQGRRW